MSARAFASFTRSDAAALACSARAALAALPRTWHSIAARAGEGPPPPERARAERRGQTRPNGLVQR
jgi:hypothetical protein